MQHVFSSTLSSSHHSLVKKWSLIKQPDRRAKHKCNTRPNSQETGGTSAKQMCKQMAMRSDPAAPHQPLTHAVTHPPAFLHDRATQSASTCRCPVAVLLKSCTLILSETGSRFSRWHCFSLLLSYEVELG